MRHIIPVFNYLKFCHARNFVSLNLGDIDREHGIKAEQGSFLFLYGHDLIFAIHFN